MVSWAPERMVVVTSLGSPDGLVGEYLSYAAAGPAPVPGTRTVDGWAGALGTQLRKAGVPVRAGYPVGDPPAGEREDVDDPLGDRAASRLPVTIR